MLRLLEDTLSDDWAKEHNSWPFLGMMASEGGQREEALIEHGCNYYGKTVMRSAPFAPFLRQDILQLALDLEVPVPEIYGQIKRKEDGTLYTTEAQGTGCIGTTQRKDRTALTAYGNAIPQNGNFGCTDA